MVALSDSRRLRWLDEGMVQRLRFGVFAVFLVICFFCGGGSRDDIASLIYLRPAAIIAAAVILILPGRVDLKPVRDPLLLCLAFCALMALQLVPLPPSMWQSLPGRAPFAEALAMAGQPQPWRPLSIAPDLTLNSLAAMVVPIAALLGFAALDGHGRRRLLPLLIGLAVVSALLGLLQLTGGERSPFYLYELANRDSPVGLFSNRNHNAALMVMAFPMIAVWAATGPAPLRLRGTRTIAAAALGVFLVPMILAIGSRAGLIFGALAAATSWAIFVQQARIARELRGGMKTILAGIGVVAVAGTLFAFAALQRASSLERLIGGEAGSDWRSENFGKLARLAGDMMPLGSGFGTFDPLWRIREGHDDLSTFYLNHAHNDLIELAMTGGLAALLLLAAGLAWYLWRTWRALRPWLTAERHILFARLGALMLAILLVWSLVDYPLRTPSIAAVAAIAAGWLGSGRRRDSSPAGAGGNAPEAAA
jgi:O-antigen ligase